MIRRWIYLLTAFVFFQRCTPTHYRLVYHSNENQTDTLEYRSIRLKQNQIRVTTTLGQKKQPETQKLWGYQEVDGAKYRIHAGQVYKVIQEKTITVYRQSNSGDGFNDDYYFSLSPDGEVFYLNTDNLKKAFKGQSCLLEILQQKPLRYWFKTGSTGTFLLIEAFQYCQQQTHEKPLADH